MFTICPKCSRQFRIYAKQIATAAGQVRCGFCRRQFNALRYLHDTPREKEAASPTITAAERKINPVPAENNDQPIKEPQFDLSGSAVEPAGNESEAQAHSAQSHVKAGPGQAVGESLSGGKSTATSGPRVKVVWGFAFFLALFAIISQLAWFNRDRLLMQYPEVRPYVKQLCEKLDCEVIREHNPTAITMINRDVRPHPVYKDTLLVNATIKNELGVKQAWPRVQLILFDTDGSISGYREFKPADYLGGGIDIESGMPVDVPVSFVLEVSGASAKAVSFEFRFL